MPLAGSGRKTTHATFGAAVMELGLATTTLVPVAYSIVKSVWLKVVFKVKEGISFSFSSMLLLDADRERPDLAVLLAVRPDLVHNQPSQTDVGRRHRTCDFFRICQHPSWLQGGNGRQNATSRLAAAR